MMLIYGFIICRRFQWPRIERSRCINQLYSYWVCSQSFSGVGCFVIFRCCLISIQFVSGFTGRIDFDLFEQVEGQPLNDFDDGPRLVVCASIMPELSCFCYLRYCDYLLGYLMTIWTNSHGFELQTSYFPRSLLAQIYCLAQHLQDSKGFKNEKWQLAYH